jgi:hypothetical protein
MGLTLLLWTNTSEFAFGPSQMMRNPYPFLMSNHLQRPMEEAVAVEVMSGGVCSLEKS